jgi:exopolysaccharide production protein ExoQ
MIYLFFVFYGTAIPFQPRITDAEDIVSSNTLNQLLYPILFFSSLICIFAKRNRVIKIIRSEKFLTLFLIWCVISISWSVDPLTSSKRVFRTITLYSVTLSFIANLKSYNEILKYIKPVLYLYVSTSVIVSLIIPGATDPQFQTWRGFTGHKNILGQESVMCILLSFFIWKKEKGYSKYVAAIVLLLSIMLLLGARSVTAITSFIVILSIASVLQIDKIFKPIKLGKTVSTLIIFSGIILTIFLFLFTNGILESFTSIAGKDITFSGRTDLWTEMIYEIYKHPFLGSGYQAFWSLNNPSLRWLYEIFIWIPTQSHNGYIDILNEVGIIGFFLFILMIFNSIMNIGRSEESRIWIWIVIAILIINIQESTLFRPGNLAREMFVISYFILFSQILFSKNKNYEVSYRNKSKYLRAI